MKDLGVTVEPRHAGLLHQRSMPLIFWSELG
jgi:hypothetical protein